MNDLTGECFIITSLVVVGSNGATLVCRRMMERKKKVCLHSFLGVSVNIVLSSGYLRVLNICYVECWQIAYVKCLLHRLLSYCFVPTDNVTPSCTSIVLYM